MIVGNLFSTKSFGVDSIAQGNLKYKFYSRCDHRESMNDNENLVGLHRGAQKIEKSVSTPRCKHRESIYENKYFVFIHRNEQERKGGVCVSSTNGQHNIAQMNVNFFFCRNNFNLHLLQPEAHAVACSLLYLL